MKWLVEELYAPIHQALRIDVSIHHGRSDFQQIDIFENAVLGKVLALDGVIQTTERDEHVYHEMLTHVPIMAHGAVKHVLIIGGGDGGMLEEVLKHPVESATMVEIDGEVVSLSRQHLPSICGQAFDDPRADVIIGDGAAFMRESDKRFDVIIVDSSDPIGPAEVLFRQEFYAACRARLTPGGVLVTQNGVVFYQQDEVLGTHRCFRNVFQKHGFYFAAVPMYVGGNMAFGWASDALDLLAIDRDALNGRWEKAGITTDYYNPDIHAASMACPSALKRRLEQGV
ncbi:MAG: spermidine synthase [Rhodospirillaceae bacterium]|nr:spermidine synthase [Rhodospirillaceae bacterium]|tara:strand:+ start:223 stop:1074 length:852 start_codon:yes stop_codon:yes gene_type:complete